MVKKRKGRSEQTRKIKEKLRSVNAHIRGGMSDQTDPAQFFLIEGTK